MFNGFKAVGTVYGVVCVKIMARLVDTGVVALLAVVTMRLLW